MLGLVVLVMGLGAATAYLLPWSLLPDAIDADPERPACLFTAWMGLSQKLGSAVAVFLLSWSGFVAGRTLEQPQLALVLLGLLVMRGWAPQQAPVQSQP